MEENKEEISTSIKSSNISSNANLEVSQPDLKILLNEKSTFERGIIEAYKQNNSIDVGIYKKKALERCKIAFPILFLSLF